MANGGTHTLVLRLTTNTPSFFMYLGDLHCFINNVQFGPPGGAVHLKVLQASGPCHGPALSGKAHETSQKALLNKA